MNWQSIETAPKDGTEVWAFNGEQARMKWISGPGYGLWAWSDELLSDAEPSPDQPTSWMPLPPAPGETAEQEDVPEAILDAVAGALGSDAYDCTRVWSAWSYGTMGPDDFAPIADDSHRVAEIARAAWAAIKESP